MFQKQTKDERRSKRKNTKVSNLSQSRISSNTTKEVLIAKSLTCSPNFAAMSEILRSPE